MIYIILEKSKETILYNFTKELLKYINIKV